MKKIITPKRGKSTEMNNANFKKYELFYVTDLKILGVVSDEGEAQLLVDVLDFDTKDEFPTKGKPSKLYKDKNGDIFFFNGENYLPVEMNIHISGAMPSWFPTRREPVRVNLGKE